MQAVSKPGVPGFVKFIAVLYYIGAGLIFFFGLGLTIFGISSLGVNSNIPESLALLGAFISLIGPFILIIGIVLLGLAVLYFFVGRGLWKGKNWARVLVIIFSFLGILGIIIALALGSVESAINGSFGAVINAVIGFYLIFNRRVREAFA